MPAPMRAWPRPCAAVSVLCLFGAAAAAPTWELLPTGAVLIEREVERSFGLLSRWAAEYRSLAATFPANATLPASISVVIPVYNGEEHVERALRSVASCARVLRASHPHVGLELIIVDDASSDRTREVVEAFVAASPELRRHARLLRNPERLGAALARNVGAEHAAAPALCFLDADDYWLDDHLLLAAKHMAIGRSKGIAYMRTGLMVTAEAVKEGWRHAIENGAPINLCLATASFRFVEGYLAAPEFANSYEDIAFLEALRWLTTVHRDQAVLRVASPTAVYTRRPGNHLDRYVRSAMMTQASLQQSYTFVEEEAKLRLIAAMKRRSEYLMRKTEYFALLAAEEGRSHPLSATLTRPARKWRGTEEIRRLMQQQEGASA